MVIPLTMCGSVGIFLSARIYSTVPKRLLKLSATASEVSAAGVLEIRLLLPQLFKRQLQIGRSVRSPQAPGLSVYIFCRAVLRKEIQCGSQKGIYMYTKTTATLLPVSSTDGLTGRKEEETKSGNTPESIDTGASPPSENSCTALAVYHPPGNTDRFSWTDQQLNMLYPLGYEVKHGCLMFKRPYDEKAVQEPVCNFVAWIVSEVTTYDGLKKTTRLTITGKHSDGSALHEVTIDASEITQNEWIVNNLGMPIFDKMVL